MTVKFQIKYYTLKTLSEFGYFNVTADNLKQVGFKLDDGGGFSEFFRRVHEESILVHLP